MDNSRGREDHYIGHAIWLRCHVDKLTLLVVPETDTSAFGRIATRFTFRNRGISSSVSVWSSTYISLFDSDCSTDSTSKSDLYYDILTIGKDWMVTTRRFFGKIPLKNSLMNDLRASSSSAGI